MDLFSSAAARLTGELIRWAVVSLRNSRNSVTENNIEGEGKRDESGGLYW